MVDAGRVQRRADSSQTSLLRMSPKPSNSSQMTRKSKRKTRVPHNVWLHCWSTVASLRKIIQVLFPRWALSVTFGVVFESFYDLTTELWSLVANNLLRVCFFSPLCASCLTLHSSRASEISTQEISTFPTSDRKRYQSVHPITSRLILQIKRREVLQRLNWQ